jgi:hypothetical protein
MHDVREVDRAGGGDDAGFLAGLADERVDD